MTAVKSDARNVSAAAAFQRIPPDAKRSRTAIAPATAKRNQTSRWNLKIVFMRSQT